MSFLWYDLETFGRDPRRSRIAQFAAIRTDEDLRELDAPVSLFCQPADDLLPSPVATVITGIAPQRAKAEGTIEAEFFARVHELMAEPGTCAVGYNSLRFDDEFIRFGLYRNFYDAYEREWRHGNSRWDLLDVLRLARALRPEGLNWPLRDDGQASFKLEDLAAANGVRDGMAHEALSDVRALIGLARKLKDAQPRFWDYVLQLRDKKTVRGLCDLVAHTPLLHVSGRFPAAQRHAALVAPIALHPLIATRVIAYDLGTDPALFHDLDDETLKARLYTPRARLAEDVQRLPLKEIHTNRCPALLPLAHVRPAELGALGLDAALAGDRAAWLAAHPQFVARCVSLYSESRDFGESDADGDLYGGFVGDADRRLFPRIRTADPAGLPAFESQLRDPRLKALLFRYQARNWPDTLDAGQRRVWDAWRRDRFHEPAPADGTLASYLTERDAAIAMAATGGDNGALAAADAWVRDRLADVGIAIPDMLS
ncbi:exodeoxyribonuclease I [Silanimonas algicola]